MSKTIVCVDDSVTMQKVASITFAATEYECVGARNVDEGLAAAKAHKPVLVLADAVMPGKTGYDLCEAIKADPELSSVLVLVMCGNSQAYDPARGNAAGADGHVTKPWDTQVMLDKVAEVLGGESGEAVSKPAAAPPRPAMPAPIASRPTAAPARPAPAPAPAPRPAPATQPTSPSALSAAADTPPEPPRSATIMGMPSLKLPPTKPAAPEFSAPHTPTPPPAPAPKPQLRETTPAPQPLGPPPRPSAPPPSPAPTPTPPPIAARPAPAPSPRPEPAPPSMRPPMIAGTPTRRPDIAALQAAAAARAVAAAPTPTPMPAPAPPPKLAPPARRSSETESDVETARVDAATLKAAAGIAHEAGLDPDGPEMAALLKLSREVIERVVWEVVPELAETIIRENVDRLAK
jgi:CheY-like chemotaxis protein